MSSRTKIVVLHLKELIYTGIFAVLGILFIILLIIMFLPRDKDTKAPPSESESENETDAVTTSYIPGVYTTSLFLSDHTIDVEVIVDSDYISSVRLVNLDEAVTTMYPLIEPAFDSLAAQIYEKQSLDGITYADENKYTSLVLLEAIRTSLEKATVPINAEEGIQQ